MKNQTRNRILIFFIIFLCILLILLYQLETPKKESFKNQARSQAQSQSQAQYTAVLIEPRQHLAIEFVLKNFTQNLDSRWNFLVFHGNNNEDYIKLIIQSIIPEESYRIKLIPLGKDNLTINDYNALLYDESFYDKIPTEIFLIFQTDSMICPPQRDAIYDFIKYDYVGAPWSKDNPEGYSVGNGGLSLRRKSKMLEKLRACRDKIKDSSGNFVYEDVFYANRCNDRVNIYKPSVEDATKFSMETIFTDKTFGLHKPWLYFKPEQNAQIETNCPGYNYLIKYNTI